MYSVEVNTDNVYMMVIGVGVYLNVKVRRYSSSKTLHIIQE